MSLGGGSQGGDGLLIGPFMEWWDKRVAKRDAKRSARAEAAAEAAPPTSPDDTAARGTDATEAS